MRTTSIFKLSVIFLTALFTVACKGNKSGEDNQKTGSVIIAKDKSQFVLKTFGH